MKYYRLKCRGKEDSSLLMDPMSHNVLDDIAKGNKGSAASLAKDRPLEEVAAGKIYRDKNGRIGLPAKLLRACLREAGRDVPYDSKRRVTGGDGATKVFGFLRILDKFLVFTNVQNGKKEHDYWQVSLERVGQTQGKGKKGGATAAVRPEFPDWEFTVHIRFDEKRAPYEKVLDKLLEAAGEDHGLGSWRPNCGGDHGQFEVIEMTEITKEEAIKAVA